MLCSRRNLSPEEPFRARLGAFLYRSASLRGPPWGAERSGAPCSWRGARLGSAALCCLLYSTARHTSAHCSPTHHSTAQHSMPRHTAPHHGLAHPTLPLHSITPSRPQLCYSIGISSQIIFTKNLTTCHIKCIYISF